MPTYRHRARKYSPPYDSGSSYESVPYTSSMNSDLQQWNNRLKGLDDAWASARYHPAHTPPPVPPVPGRQPSLGAHEQSIRYSPGRSSSNPIAYHASYGSPPVSLQSHTRSRSRADSRPTSSHASDNMPLPLPPVPQPPPASFVAHVKTHRRRVSQPKESPKVLSRRSRLWPPEGFSRRDIISPDEAERLIGRGASNYRGYDEEVKHAPPGHYRFFAVIDQESNARSDRASFQHPAFESVTLNMTGHADSAFPWTALEQPSMAAAYGKSPGTTTLTYYVGKSGNPQTPVLFGSKAKARKMKLIAILERLKDLESMGIEDEDIRTTYNFLYTKLIEDPEAETNPHYDRAMQMADLITVLSNPDWIDFGKRKDQVVAKWFDSDTEKDKRKFFHQLLLATELYLRIESHEHKEAAKRALLAQVPPKVAWDLALAQRWLENMSIERSQLSDTQSTFTFTLASKRQQKEALHRFAELLKWPNMDELEYILEESDHQEKSIEDRSRDAMSWFTGVILPGATLPWLLMNTLIDCDRDTGDELNKLTHMYPNAGFQYRANTYWSSQCIVGKVLGAGRGVDAVAGWIGPCVFTPELARTQCVLVRQVEALDQRLTLRDVRTMAQRTCPVGPEAEDYLVEDYDVIAPDTANVEDIIRIQKLSFNPISSKRDEDSTKSRTFDAAIMFAFAQDSVPIKLRYNVDFIQAFPCANAGPHALYRGYRHRVVRVDDGLLEMSDWAAQNGLSKGARSSRRSRTSSPANGMLSPRNLSRNSSMTRGANSRALARVADLDSHLHDLTLHSRSRSASPAHMSAWKGVKEVLVIEAFGVSDNEVFARAWCASQGVSAVVANIRETCVACAVREAYAACLTVVVLTEGGKQGEKD